MERAEHSTESQPPPSKRQIEPWQVADALASWEFAVAEARRRLLAGEPPMEFFTASFRGGGTK